MEKVTINATPEGRPRTETLMGREFQVFPAVLVRSQVLNNNLGKTFLPEDEIAASADAWNGIPVVIRHPTNGQRLISARDPKVLNERGVGFLFRSRFEDAALKADVFVDLGRASDVPDAGDVVNQVESGQVGELSTGFGTNLEAQSGEHEGQEFDAIMRDVRPDHLALLVGEKGACSVKDGCGLGVNCNCGGDVDEKQEGRFAQAIDKLVAFLSRAHPADNQEDGMDRDQVIAALQEAGCPLKAERLAELEDEELQALHDALPGEEEPAGDNAQNDEPTSEVAALKARMAQLEEAAATMSEQLQAEKSGLVSELAKNERCAFDEPELEAMNLEQLNKLRASVRGENYAGRGGPKAGQNQTDEPFAPVRPYYETEE